MASPEHPEIHNTKGDPSKEPGPEHPDFSESSRSHPRHGAEPRRYHGSPNHSRALGDRSLLSDHSRPSFPAGISPCATLPKPPTLLGDRAAPARCSMAAVTINLNLCCTTPAPPARLSPNFGELDKIPTSPSKKAAASSARLHPTEKNPQTAPAPRTSPVRDKEEEDEDGSPSREGLLLLPA